MLSICDGGLRRSHHCQECPGDEHAQLKNAGRQKVSSIKKRLSDCLQNIKPTLDIDKNMHD